MLKILVSSCFLGNKVRYDGQDCLQSHERLQAWVKADKVIVLCPEMAGELPTPRAPAEIEKGKTAQAVLDNKAKVITVNGDDVTKEYVAGAQKALALVKEHHIQVAILKARSPSCGSTHVYDGSYSSQLVSGQGVTAALLIKHGIQVFDETQIDDALDAAESLDS